ncbi:heavy-metal-associated domain-containing protein [Devosia sp.]|uniref:heavy-metal-associated domain-containing protein n=1 Tax=Devosia sp. TaxID=1871048 RepID=UPI003F6E7ED1
MYNFQVSDMTCSHCVATVERAIKTVDGAAAVKIDLAGLAVKIESAKPAASFAAAIQEAGYTPLLRG